MKCLGQFEDTVYPDQKILTSRITARGFIMDSQGRIGMNHVLCDDEFGHRDHLESCGGGIKPAETPKQALLREAEEELGVRLTDIRLIGYIDDEYHLLQRKTRSIFFTARCTEERLPLHWTDFEKTLLTDPVWMKPQQLLERLAPGNNSGIALLVSQRDRCALIAALEDNLFDFPL